MPRLKEYADLIKNDKNKNNNTSSYSPNAFPYDRDCLGNFVFYLIYCLTQPNKVLSLGPCSKYE